MIAFKEWANVCEALITGQSAVILRKGGIHEGRGGFEFKHPEFALFPTWFHTQGSRLKWTPPEPERFQFPPEDERQTVDIDGHARLVKVWKVTDWAKVEALAPLHVWDEQIVKERFVYDDESCLHVALVRAYKLPARWTFPYERGYGGCRSWVTVPEPPAGAQEGSTVAMNDAAFDDLSFQISRLLD
ncbi:MAG: DUF1802 family protein [Verrucomicrobiaceae bacterium]|nr:DUF1802 family protein [Verrucomicrobiaceae bacterium]